MTIDDQNIQESDLEDFLIRLKRSRPNYPIIEDDPIARADNLQDVNQFFKNKSQETLSVMVDDYGLLPLLVSVVCIDQLHLLLNGKSYNIDGVKRYLKTCIDHYTVSSIELFQLISILDNTTPFNTKRQLKQDLFNWFMNDMLSQESSEKTCLNFWLSVG